MIHDPCTTHRCACGGYRPGDDEELCVCSCQRELLLSDNNSKQVQCIQNGDEEEKSANIADDVVLTFAKHTADVSSTHNDDVPTTKNAKKKRVRWSMITVHEFGVGLGGSAVSNKGGPSIGLADTPEFTWTTKVGEMAERSEGVHRFTPEQRIKLLQAAGISDGMIERYSRETNIILGSRRRTFLEDLAEERKEKSRKRNAEQAMMERPCSVYLRRPRMIPANYV